jgi:short-subunit dehydrogenase
MRYRISCKTCRPARRDQPTQTMGGADVERKTSQGTGRAVALITGASSGIGAEFARVLAARRYDLVLVARRRDRLEELARELSRRHGVTATPLAADLSREDELETVANRIRDENRLELLVNNAGFGAMGNFHEAALAPQITMHRLHIMAVVRLIHAALPGLVAKNRGGVINVSSVAAYARMPGHASYDATKAWMNAFTECLHLELKSIGSRVRVQALCPGYTRTEFHDVLGMDRTRVMPVRSLWMSAEFVVNESLRGLRRGDWFVIPGWRYRALVRLSRLLPRFILYPTQMLLAHRRNEAASDISAGKFEG